MPPSSKGHKQPAKNPQGAALRVQHASHLHVGPIPDAAQLEHYNSIVPGAADRIIGMAEAQQKHMHRRERRDQWIVVAGMVFALFIASAIIGVAYYMVASGTDGIGQVLWPLATVASVAIGGKVIHRPKGDRATRIL
ncbi:MAG: DUF2335 domain-containing protein [Bacteroidetes bacterium]|nr:DUF2335 domain-containing protein [Bacteroidota bacterium]